MSRLPAGGTIDRSSRISFSFDGKRYHGHAGDTLASALLANDVRLIGRSFKYHRPRGIYTSGPEEPNALVTHQHGGVIEPNTRATCLELYEGLRAASQNRWPSLTWDVMGINQWFSSLIPAGFYYKTFMWPASWWMFYERFIRRAAGMGVASRDADPSRYERNHLFCDVLVVGAGPAGLSAALAAGRAGARVLVMESEPLLGGALWRDDEAIDDTSADRWLQLVTAELRSLPNARILLRTTVFGYYDHNVLAAIERVSDHLAVPNLVEPRQRLHIVRAKRVVLATGAIERPLVFENNDRPGIMLASAVRTYLRRFAVAAGSQAVVFTNNNDAYRTAIALRRSGIPVGSIVDSRTGGQGAFLQEARRLGIECHLGYAVCRAHGRLTLTGVEIVPLSGRANSKRTRERRLLECDLLAVSGGFSPTVHLHSQSGGKVVFDERVAAFVPGASKQAERSVGAATGLMTVSAGRSDGYAGGVEAAIALGFRAPLTDLPRVSDPESDATTPLWFVPSAQRKAFVDLQDDVTSSDIELAHREGYVSVEHLKRYTTLGMGTDQGKTSNLNGLALMAALRQQSIAKMGTTTFRPPYVPITMGAFAGRERGLHYQPIRRTPMHDWHLSTRAQMSEMGLWMRPRCYPKVGEDLRQAYIREAAHVRRAVGLIDVSTLGKIDIQGPDALNILERVYVNNWRSLPVGRVRYGVMLREDGMVFDDGTTARLSEHHYYMTTTTANAAKVLAHLEFLLQVIWPNLSVQVTSVTDQWGTCALAGPRSRTVLARVIEGGMAAISNEVLPHLGVVCSSVAGMPSRVFRMTYSGELAYEIATPADQALHVWEALLEAGRVDDIQPYGTEAMGALRIEKGHIAAPELDGRTTADDLGLSSLVSRRKDFIGRRLSQRPELRGADRLQLIGLLPLNPKTRLRAGAQIVDTPRPAGITPMIGHVSSMTYSPAMGHDIALALVKAGRARLGEMVYAAFPLKNEVVPVRIVESIFYDKAGARYRG
jgi:sarcosine oxidase subunit alpha